MSQERPSGAGAVQISLSLLRVVAGFLLVQAGGMKVFGWFGLMPGGPAPILSQLGIGGVLEVIGGTAIILGLFTRPIAFLLSGQMAVAYWQFHFPNGRWPIQNQGQPAVLLCFILLFLAAYGAGDISLDAMIRRRKKGDRDTSADQ